MIVIPLVADNTLALKPERLLSAQESATVLFVQMDGTNAKYYQKGDTLPPMPAEEPGEKKYFEEMGEEEMSELANRLKKYL
jgi:hypothetical protein